MATESYSNFPPKNSTRKFQSRLLLRLKNLAENQRKVLKKIGGKIISMEIQISRQK
jgi:hypothetical protein